jgi:hypothetical protein
METRDISRSGMFIMADDAPDVGQHLKVAFEGDEGRIEFDAEVMWRGGKGEDSKIGMGVRIVSFSSGEDAYERIIKEQLGEGSEPADKEPPQGGSHE